MERDREFPERTVRRNRREEMKKRKKGKERFKSPEKEY